MNDVLTWHSILGPEKEKPYFKKAYTYVQQQRHAGKTIYPNSKDVFNAFKYIDFSSVKVVILGQDPYHGPNQAHGLCFSVQKGISPPPSLLNIFKELKDDCGIATPTHGCLEHWAKQGVLLLNAVLTVEAGKANSHAHIGWQEFTDQVITKLNEHGEKIVFLLWGSQAQKKGAHINPRKHFILKAPHPSPLSAHRGFLGCKHFSKTNQILQDIGKQPIDWELPS